MFLRFRKNPCGIDVEFNKKKYNLEYPENIWKGYPKPAKDFLVDNIAHLSTICSPLIAEKNNVRYNTSLPMFSSFFRDTVINSLPHATDDYNQSTTNFIRNFMNIDFQFKDANIKVPFYDAVNEEKALLPLSCGKDSLLSLAVCTEIGLKPTCVYINDTVSPTENKTKLKLLKKVAGEFKVETVAIKNEIEQINDFETHGAEETCVSYCHMIPGFAFISLPATYYYKTKYIVIGNQQDMNFSFVNKEGFRTIPSYNQTSVGTKEISGIIRASTKDNVRVVSVIEPLTNIAIMKLLHTRYKEYGKYQISCDLLDRSNEDRWCHNCSKCARLSLFMIANNQNPKEMGMRGPMLSKKHKRCYALFNGKEQDVYEKSKEAIEQQMFAFYLAHRNGYKGYMMDMFKKRFLNEAKEREDEFHNKFFKVYEPITLPPRIKRKVVSLYKEELG